MRNFRETAVPREVTPHWLQGLSWSEFHPVANQAFVRDWQDSKSTPDAAEYMKRYFVDRVGHVNPNASHLVAYALNSKVVSWLSPKSLPYQAPGEKDITFQGYLHGGVYKSNPALEY